MTRLRTPGCLAIYGVQGQGPAHSVFQRKQFPYAVPGQMTFIPTAVEGSRVAAAQTATSELVECGHCYRQSLESRKGELGAFVEERGFAAKESGRNYLRPVTYSVSNCMSVFFFSSRLRPALRHPLGAAAPSAAPSLCAGVCRSFARPANSAGGAWPVNLPHSPEDAITSHG
ncbi:hypothetical protein BH23CHL4_BH23CHL4_20700 [soil metagenome]